MKNKITGLSNNDGVVGLCADMYDRGFDYWIGCKKKKFNKTLTYVKCLCGNVMNPWKS